MTSGILVAVVVVLGIGIALQWQFSSIPAALVTLNFHVNLLLLKWQGFDEKIQNQSIESAAFEKLLRARPPGNTTNYIEVRENVDGFKHVIPIKSDIRIIDFVIPVPNENRKIPARWVIPPNYDDSTPKKKILFWLHGGGYIAGSINSHSGAAAELARRTTTKCLLIEYRLAPEHPLPAATEDALLVYRWITQDQKISPSSIVIVGDSAGGGLTFLTLIAIREQKDLKLPIAAATLSPWTNLAAQESVLITKLDSDAMINPWSLISTAKIATNNEEEEKRKSPLVSPHFADLHGLPPLFISVGTAELLLYDSLEIAEKARSAGVKVTLDPVDKMQHVFPVFFDWFPEADKAFSRIASFISSHIQ